MRSSPTRSNYIYIHDNNFHDNEQGDHEPRTA